MSNSTNKPNGIPVGIVMDVNALETKFTDLVNLEPFQDYIVLNFLQTFPVQPPNASKVDLDAGIRSAKIASRVGISWPHFARFIEMAAHELKNNESIAKDLFEKSLGFSEKTKFEDPAK